MRIISIIVMLLVLSSCAVQRIAQAKAEVEKAEKKVYEGRPLFVLDIIKLPSWRTIRPKEQEIFKIKNIGFRPARSVRMDPITSRQGKSRAHKPGPMRVIIPAMGVGPTLLFQLW